MSGAGLQSVGTRIRTCSTCETPLPLCEALDAQQARVWTCTHCDAEFSGMLTPNYTVAELRCVRPESITFDPATIQPVCAEMLDFAQRFGAREGRNIEKRSSIRHPLVATLAAVELDEQLLPLGQPFQTICRNLSMGGICLINDRSVQHDYLALELKGAGGVPIQTVAHVLRRRPIGPYHDIGTEFVTKFANPKSTKRSEQ